MSDPIRRTPGIADDEPRYWMYEVSGTLAPAIQAYLAGGDMTPEHIVYVRSYLRQWIASSVWRGGNVDLLRATVGLLTTRAAIDSWLEVAERDGIDPL